MPNHYISLITTKLSPPRLDPLLLKRSRLINDLEKNRSLSLTLIMGPAGYGKTTLMAQWREMVEQSGRHTAWLTIVEEDNVPDQFLSYLCAAFKRMEPAISVQIEEFSELGSARMPRQVIIELINALADKKTHYSLFIDDYHEINNTEIHELVQLLVNNLPNNVNLYIGSRSLPPLTLSRLKVAGQVHLIGYESLRFDQAEARQFFQKRQQSALSETQLQDLRQITEGWPAAMQLASMSLIDKTNVSQIINNLIRSEKSVTDFLAEEIFNQLPADIFTMLQSLSIVDCFNHQLCYAINEQQSMESLMTTPVVSALLMQYQQQCDKQTDWYRFHPLISSYLSRCLNKTADKSKRLAYHHRAADWFNHQGYIVEAVKHYLLANQQDTAFELLEQRAMDMLEQGQLQLFVQQVEKLPQHKIACCEQILLPLAWAQLLAHNFQETPKILKQIEVGLENIYPENRKFIQSEMLIIQATMLMFSDDVDGCEAQINRACSLLPESPIFDQIVMTNLKSYIYLNRYQFEQLYLTQQQAEPYKKQLTNPGSMVYGILAIGLGYFEQGRLLDANEQGIHIDELPFAVLTQGKSYNLLGKLLQSVTQYQLANLTVSESLCDENLPSLYDYAPADLLLYLVITKGRLLQHKQQEQKALNFYTRIQRVAQERQLLRIQACILHEKIRMYVQNNDLDSAQNCIDDGQQTILESDSGTNAQVWEWLTLAKSRLNIAQKTKLLKTEHQLQELVTRFHQQGRRYRQLDTLLLLVCCYQQQHKSSEALNTLKQAFAIDDQQGWQQVFIDADIILLPCYQDFLNSAVTDSEKAYCQTIIDNIQSKATKSDAEIISPITNVQTQSEASLLEPLTPKELGVLNKVATGLSNREISEQLFVSVETVKSHLKSIYSKMNVARRTQAVILARKLQLITDEV